MEFLTVYVETASGTSPFHIDDFTMSYVPPSPIQTDIPSLKNVLAADFPIGAAIGMPQTLGERARLLTRHFSQVTPGNALKWDAIQPTEGAFRYTDADALVAFAKANNLRVRGHTFVWHNQTPAWVFTDASGQPMTATAANKTLLLTRLENHIRAVGTRYANDIYAWDVVNEVIDENQADGLRRSTWFNIAGLDYIRTAFRVARQVAPTARLYINDYNTNVPAKRDKLFTLVQQLRAEGVPIDGVGHQMHSNVDWPTGADTDAMIAKFIPLGVLQEITEMDVSIYTSNGETFPTPPADRLTRQAARYKALFDVYRKYKANLASVTLWGIADDDTWLDTIPVNRKDAPLLFDVSLQAKPAYWSIVGTTSSTPGTTTTTTTSRPPTTTTTSRPPTTTTTTTPPPSGGCTATFRVIGTPWPGGFQGSITVVAGSSGVNGWTVHWTNPTGQASTVTPTSWNSSIPAGGSVEFGFLGSRAGAAPAVTNLTCS